MKTRLLLTLTLLFCGGHLCAQTLTTGYVYGGATFGKRLDGAGRFGIGLDFRLTPKVDLGGEIGSIHKNDVGILGSGNVTYHFTRGSNGRDPWDPFLVTCRSEFVSMAAPDDSRRHISI
jgi:hypothetical protein